MPGQSSPRPSSDVTPGSTLCAARRIVSASFTPFASNALPSTAIIASVELFSPGLCFNVQLIGCAVSI